MFCEKAAQYLVRHWWISYHERPGASRLTGKNEKKMYIHGVGLKKPSDGLQRPPARLPPASQTFGRFVRIRFFSLTRMEFGAIMKKNQGGMTIRR
ncbi:MAG: hypothetical protein ACI4MP_04885 [Candidatus Ventricola sp.]